MLSKVRVLLVDDHRILRDGLQGLLKQDDGVTVAATAGTASEGLTKALGAAVDVALIDLELPDHDGVWLLKQLKEMMPDIAVVVLSMHSDEATVLKVLEAGAEGYLTKAADPREVLAAIKAVHGGSSYLQNELAPYLVTALRKKGSPEAAAHPRLEPREQEILRRAALGQSNQKIADELFVSVSTVKANLRSLFRKLDVSTRTEAVLEALRRKELDDPMSPKE